MEERQELAALFGEEAFKIVHKVSAKNGWKDSSAEKIALHAFVGGVMSELGGNNFASGAIGAGLNEAVMKHLKNISDPALHQWASAVIGGAASAVVGGNVQSGASTAASGTKNNFFFIPAALIAEEIALIFGMSFIATPEGQKIVNKAGEVVATWSDTVGGWIDDAGTAIGESITDLYLWAKQSKKSGKEKADDAPSWAKGNKPRPDQSGKEFAEELCDAKYGKGNYGKGPGSDYNRIKKWADRSFK